MFPPEQLCFRRESFRQQYFEPELPGFLVKMLDFQRSMERQKRREKSQKG
jgi:hypothetical protein